MKNTIRGFIPILIAIVITAILTAGTGMGIYKYNQIKEENKELNEELKAETPTIIEEVDEIDDIDESETTIATQRPQENAVVSIPAEEDITSSSINWFSEEQEIPNIRSLINSNNKSLNETRGYIDDLDYGISTIIELMQDPYFLDDTGTVLAQECLRKAEELKSAYYREIIAVSDQNKLLENLITAVFERDEVKFKSTANEYSTKNPEMVSLVKENVVLFSEYKDAWDNFEEYIS